MRGNGVHVTVREPVLVSDKFLFLLSRNGFLGFVGQSECLLFGRSQCADDLPPVPGLYFDQAADILPVLLQYLERLVKAG